MKKIFWFLWFTFLVCLNTMFQHCTQEAVTSMSKEDALYGIMNWFYTYSTRFAIGAGILLGVANAYQKIYVRSRKEKELWAHHRGQILKIALRELFEDNYDTVRITLFKDMGFGKALWRYLTNIISGRINPIKDIPFGKIYIEVWERYGSQYQNSNTFFVCDTRTSKTCEGVAGQVRQNHIARKVVRLPNISDIDISSWQESDLVRPRPEINPLDVDKVKTYMKKGYISNLCTLKAVHVKARHIFGDILYNRSGKDCGVIVIDSTKECNPFNDEVVKSLRAYAQIIGNTIYE